MLKDGMDIGLCTIDVRTKKLEYAGAFFPLYIIRDNKLTEIKGDRLSVGLVTTRMSLQTATCNLRMMM
ncbi:MAG: hypothetical protein R2744_06015 [Bacteroidales bacterium]